MIVALVGSFDGKENIDFCCGLMASVSDFIEDSSPDLDRGKFNNWTTEEGGNKFIFISSKEWDNSPSFVDSFPYTLINSFLSSTPSFFSRSESCSPISQGAGGAPLSSLPPPPNLNNGLLTIFTTFSFIDRFLVMGSITSNFKRCIKHVAILALCPIGPSASNVGIVWRSESICLAIPAAKEATVVSNIDRLASVSSMVLWLSLWWKQILSASIDSMGCTARCCIVATTESIEADMANAASIQESNFVLLVEFMWFCLVRSMAR